MNRRLPALIVVVALPLVLLALYPLGVVSKGAPPVTPTFAAPGAPTLPFVPKAKFVTSTWFCGGVPNGADSAGGSATVVNPADAPMQGRLTVFSDAAGVAPAERSFEVPARAHLTTVLSTVQPTGSYLSAMVEITGGGGFVEQTAVTAAGNAVSACANSTSGDWYFADNYTLNGSHEDLVITNPFPDDAILDFIFASNAGTRRPQNLQGFPVPAHSVAIVSETNLPKDEAVLAVTIHASRGRVVAARAQNYQGERNGYSLMLGAPSLSSEWSFPDGEAGPDVAFERYSLYNPTAVDVTVTTNMWGITQSSFVGYRTDTIPAGNVLSFTTRDFGQVPVGRHGMTFSTEGDASIVVEQGITRKAGDAFVTSVVMGAPQVFEGYSRWSMAVGTGQAAPNVLIVMNLDSVAGTVTVKTLGAGGEMPVKGLEKVVLAKAGITAIAIPQLPGVLGSPLVVE
ncbi:MAG: DUF5719 family protein, partial [Actinomycetota bacterium]